MSQTYCSIRHFQPHNIENSHWTLFGLKDTALQWLSSYISDKQFSVQISNSLSQTHTINFSIPQGSILGPVLFNMLCQCLPEVIKQTTDTNILGYTESHAFTQAFTQKDILVKYTIEEECIEKKLDVNEPSAGEWYKNFGTSHLLSEKNLYSITVRGIPINC